MLNKEIKRKMIDKLYTDTYEKNDASRRIAEFMIWAVDHGNHADIAAEIISGVKNTKAALKHCTDKAQELADGKNSIMLEDAQVYGFVAEYLGLQDCMTADDITEYITGGLKLSPKKAPKPAKNSASLDLGIDSLFD